ncbi:hypothetical protein [Pseudacidovorax sp. RU35E]|uniref:hypothetical protein n=1 Tax=Pseudacidovorax sp. RU35E TaxID=1907403 RepID=UPI00095475E3|nr:hypothetical protein [Pseudacidovorax sp. RU35E]SIR00007.1 hypothetical protein SAMN05880557_10783 [Pseudacidovorax sp. RU35E]
MLIKFKAPDPRAGTTADMDSSRGQYFIDTGAAVRVKADGTEEVAPAPRAPAPPAGGNAKPSDGLTVAEIKEALAAREIAIPDGVTLKADLAAMLDNAPAS